MVSHSILVQDFVNHLIAEMGTVSAPDPGPTSLADPNRSPGRDTIYTIYWDSH